MNPETVYVAGPLFDEGNAGGLNKLTKQSLK